MLKRFKPNDSLDAEWQHIKVIEDNNLLQHEIHCIISRETTDSLFHFTIRKYCGFFQLISKLKLASTREHSKT